MACDIERTKGQLSMVDVCISIVAWNGLDLLKRCLESVFQGTNRVSYSVVVVDNGSTEDIVGMVRREFPQAEIISNTSNLGFAAANNQALRLYAGRARYFLLLNPDTVITRGAIDDLVAYIDGWPEAGIAGCKLVKPDGTLDWPCKRSYITPSIFLYRALGLDTRCPEA